MKAKKLFGLSIMVVAAASASMSTGCATMIRGTHESLNLESTSEGATANLSDGESCTTPCSENIARDASLSITFAKPGCNSQTVAVFPTLAGAGVLMGGIVDYGTGAVYDLQPNPVITTLTCRPIDEAKAASAPAAVSSAPAEGSTLSVPAASQAGAGSDQLPAPSTPLSNPVSQPGVQH